MNRILLRKGRERSVLKGHPWVFSGAVESGDASAGELVEVCDSKGGKIALGWYSPASQIRVRIVPGATLFTVTPSFANCMARFRERFSCALLSAL